MRTAAYLAVRRGPGRGVPGVGIGAWRAPADSAMVGPSWESSTLKTWSAPSRCSRNATGFACG